MAGIDYSKLTDEELAAINSGDYSKLSDELVLALSKEHELHHSSKAQDEAIAQRKRDIQYDPFSGAAVGTMVGGSSVLAKKLTNLGGFTPPPPQPPEQEYVSPGQKYKAKTGYGAGEGETQAEVLAEAERREGPLGKGKVTRDIKGGPLGGEAAMERIAEKEADEIRAARIRAQEKAAADRAAYAAAQEHKFSPITGVGTTLPIAGATFGYNATDVLRRGLNEPVQSGISAAGALGSVAPFVKSLPPKTRALGVGASVAAPIVNSIIDKIFPEQSALSGTTLPQKATGGSVQHLAGGKLVTGVLEEAARRILPHLSDAGKTGKQLLRESQYVHDIRPTHEFSQISPLSIQDLQGKVLVAVPGDRSLTGKTVHSVAGVPLANPVEQHGGPLYGLRKADLGEDAFWASQQGAASGLQNKAARAELEHDMPAYGIYAAMAPDSSNFALHHTETLLNQLPALNPSKKNIKDFDAMIRAQFPSFGSINDPEIMEYLRTASPDVRKLIAAQMNKAKFSTELGLPSGEATTHAITEPALRDIATGTTGYAVGELRPHQKLSVDVSGDHPTYNTQIPGQFKGSMIAQLPWQEYFPDAAAKIAANPKHAPYAWGTFKMGDYNQPVTQELVDKIAPIEERILKEAGYKKGGKTKRKKK